jgi:hypothetical protein
MKFLLRKYVFAARLVPEVITAAFLFISGTPVASALVAPSIPLNSTYVTNSLCNFTNWLFYGLLMLTVVMVLLAGYNYMTSSGDPEKVDKAGKMILYAAIGFAIGLFAKGFPGFIVTLTGVTASTSACP